MTCARAANEAVARNRSGVTVSSRYHRTHTFGGTLSNAFGEGGSMAARGRFGQFGERDRVLVGVEYGF